MTTTSRTAADNTVSNLNDPEVAGEQASDLNPSYELRISRLTVDKLGVKLYDKASAVVAELIANGYDADAETVTVRILKPPTGFKSRWRA